MEHLESSCIKMLNDVMTGHQLVRYKMITELTAAWRLNTQWRMDHAEGASSSAIDKFIWKNHLCYYPNKKTDRTIRGYSIRDTENGWIMFTDSDPDKPMPLKDHLRQLGLPAGAIPDIIRLPLEPDGFVTPKGRTFQADAFYVWLYDPKNYFWS
ncbi:hypothetical protein MZD04_gp330 [Pseudomonas phage Psa21]|uniref:Uncharacterized protein n=1 Tax=Pseudomonas phage Psa21 TaxID=2530023 RepID=A0A481W4V6_9CAUD|nr:hypothetical protein MZD04_gp330 [Pseudomonas phage Psa21]QBJ02856.1 hypothetical protein PSA21_330 [Pseudomonas phage Psa21]